MSRKLSLGGLSREVHGGAFPQKYYYYWGVIIKFPLSGLRTWRAGEEAYICLGRAGIGGKLWVLDDSEEEILFNFIFITEFYWNECLWECNYFSENRYY